MKEKNQLELLKDFVFKIKFYLYLIDESGEDTLTLREFSDILDSELSQFIVANDEAKDFTDAMNQVNVLYGTMFRRFGDD